MRDLQHVEHAVARILAETDQPVEVYEAALEAIGRAVDCGLGAAWELDPETGDLRCVRTWSAGGAADEFQAVSESLTLAPGVGLPGRVLATGEPAWLVDVPADPNFPRATAARRDGLRAVVEIALDPLALSVRHLDEPRARRLQLVRGRHPVGDVAQVAGERR